MAPRTAFALVVFALIVVSCGGSASRAEPSDAPSSSVAAAIAPSIPDQVVVSLRAFQHSWEFTYHLDGGVPGAALKPAVRATGSPDAPPFLVLPVDSPVEIVMSSSDVPHSFYVRDFLYRLDVEPHAQNSFKVTARQVGDYEGSCTVICGTGHDGMRFTLRIVSRAEFEAYLNGLPVTEAARPEPDERMLPPTRAPIVY